MANWSTYSFWKINAKQNHIEAYCGVWQISIGEHVSPLLLNDLGVTKGRPGVLHNRLCIRHIFLRTEKLAWRVRLVELVWSTQKSLSPLPACTRSPHPPSHSVVKVLFHEGGSMKRGIKTQRSSGAEMGNCLGWGGGVKLENLWLKLR